MAFEITFDYCNERFNAFDALPPSIKRKILTDPDHCNLDWMIDCGIRNFALVMGQMALDMAGCQSPIEMLMFIALEKIRHKEYVLEIETQKEMVCNGNQYRADFLITFGEYFPERCNERMLVVECDGHDFHEKTKQQASRDKKRDRDMQSEGYSVLRFTGSEIHKDADKCAGEIYSLISKAMS